MKTPVLAGNLEDLNTLGVVSSDGEIIVGTGSGAFAYESGATLRTSIGLGTGDSPQFTNVTLTGDIVSLSNADVDITPHGTGNVVLKTDLVSLGGGSEVGHISSNGAYDMKISSNSGTNSGTIVITDAADGAITLAPNGTGIVDIQGSMNSSISTTGKALVFGL
jgi:hypothetical protein